MQCSDFSRYFSDLEQLIEKGSEPSKLVAELSRVKDILISEFSINADYLSEISNALISQDWDKVTQKFCSNDNSKYNLYLGPMRAMEKSPLEMGFLLLENTPYGKSIFELVQSHAASLGEGIFGFPCDFMGRKVEFHNIVAGAGPFIDNAGRRIALFTPFYLPYDKKNPSQYTKRTIIFHNFLANRFRYLSLPLANSHLLIDDNKPAFLNASDNEINQAVTLWICLHELFHSSGPLPLFNSTPSKLALGLRYADIEEARVDLTALVALNRFKHYWGQIAEIAEHIILAEKIFRSGRINGTYSEALDRIDGGNAALFLGLLDKNGAVSLDEGDTIKLDSESLYSSILPFLKELYLEEADAAELGEEKGVQALNEMAKRIRTSLEPQSGYPYQIADMYHRFYDQFNAHPRELSKCTTKARPSC